MFFQRSPRQIYVLLAACCAGLLSFGYYLELSQGLQPCPLCIFQRLLFLAVLIFSLWAAFVAGSRLVILPGVLVVLSAVSGVLLAARHLWLQNLPEHVLPPACGPGLGHMLDIMPFTEVLVRVLRGDGTCVEVAWQFLGLSIPGWSILGFAGLSVASIWLLSRVAGFPRPR